MNDVVDAVVVVIVVGVVVLNFASLVALWICLLVVVLVVVDVDVVGFPVAATASKRRPFCFDNGTNTTKVLMNFP